MNHFCWAAREATKVESMEAPTKPWRKKAGGTVMTDDVTGSENQRDGDDAKAWDGISELECVKMTSWLAVWLWSS